MKIEYHRCAIENNHGLYDHGSTPEYFYIAQQQKIEDFIAQFSQYAGIVFYRNSSDYPNHDSNEKTDNSTGKGNDKSIYGPS